jgi:hypothetical protein
VDEVSLQSRITEYNEKLFKAYRVFNSGKGAYGIRARRYEFDGTPGGMAWLLIKDGKAESGRYDYWQSNPRSDKRMFVKWYGTAMKIGYYQYIPDVSKIGGYADKPEWVEDEHGLAITNVPYRIRFTAPTQWGGFYCPTRNKNG